jgi:outer membrane immunogenic protein
MVKRVTAVVLVMAIFLGLSGSVYAQEKKPDATLTLTEGQIAVGIWWSWGKGVLTYQGKEYPFKTKGLSVIDVGITKASASGKVYRLEKLENFNGTYSGGSAEGTIGGGAGVTRVQNQNGVILELVSTTQGVNFKFAGEGVTFTLEK